MKQLHVSRNKNSGCVKYGNSLKNPLLWSLNSLYLYRFWAERSTLPTTSWEESRLCTIMESHTPLCQMTLKASSLSCSGSLTCQRFSWMFEVLYSIKSRSIVYTVTEPILQITNQTGASLLTEQTLPCAHYRNYRSSRQRDRIHSYQSTVWSSLDAGWQTSSQWVVLKLTL